MLELIGLVSGILVIVSIIPYALRTYQGKIHPNLTSFALWSLIGLAILLTYKSSGAKANVWPAVFSFTNPILITFLVIRQRGRLTRFGTLEIICLVIGLISLGLWVIARGNVELSRYALYFAISADACAGIPTAAFVWKHPDRDRPFAWVLFAIGYALAFFSIAERTFANYILPAYMCSGSLCIAAPLILYRWKKKIPLSEWF